MYSRKYPYPPPPPWKVYWFAPPPSPPHLSENSGLHVASYLSLKPFAFTTLLHGGGTYMSTGIFWDWVVVLCQVICLGYLFLETLKHTHAFHCTVV